VIDEYESIGETEGVADSDAVMGEDCVGVFVRLFEPEYEFEVNLVIVAEICAERDAEAPSVTEVV